jgi:hypoxanthine phosphoribosyltransferase
MSPLALTWAEVDQSVRSFVSLYREAPLTMRAEGVYGEARGGLIPAVMLSHYLQIPLLKERPSSGVYLWVDDIVDSGETVEIAIATEKAIALRWALCLKARSRVAVNYGIFVNDDRWVIFPWEDPEQANQDFLNYHAKHL